MISRRALLLALGAASLGACNTVQSEPKVTPAAKMAAADMGEPQYVSAIDGPEPRPKLPRQLVTYRGNEPPGAIVIRTNERRLYLVLGDGTAIRYPVGVGRAGKQWEGWAEVEGKHVEPAWSPPVSSTARGATLRRGRECSNGQGAICAATSEAAGWVSGLGARTGHV